MPLHESRRLDQLPDARGSNLYELSVQIVSPSWSRKRSSRCPSDVLGRRLTRCISTRDASRVPDGAVRESVQVEVGAQLRIHAQQQVLVEGRGQAERIVVGEQQIAFRLDEIGAEQQGVAGPKRRADQAEGSGRARRVEVPDVRAEERDERRVRIRRAGSASSPSS